MLNDFNDSTLTAERIKGLKRSITKIFTQILEMIN